MAVAHVRPDLARRHILLAASRQFGEGDVQHWWLQETGAGVRTHISDDTVWLAYCTCKYLELTGDDSILDEKCTWLEGAAVRRASMNAFYIPRLARRQTRFMSIACGRCRTASLSAHMGCLLWNRRLETTA